MFPTGFFPLGYLAPGYFPAPSSIQGTGGSGTLTVVTTSALAMSSGGAAAKPECCAKALAGRFKSPGT